MIYGPDLKSKSLSRSVDILKKGQIVIAPNDKRS